MEQSKTPIRIELEGEILDAVEVAPGLAIIRAFPSAEACRFGDLVAFEPGTLHEALDEEGQPVQCYTFLRVEEPGGYRQFRCPCAGGGLEDVAHVARDLWRKKVALQALEDEDGEQWLEIAVPKEADLRQTAEEIMDLCSLIGVEAWPYELLLQAGLLEEVAELVERVTVGGPRAAYLYFVLARTMEAAERFEEALASYRKAVERDPDSVILQENLAICLANAGRSAEAEQVFRAALERFPQDPTLRQNFNRFLEGEGRIVWLRFDLN
jgi:tetratricopeptide (TPR) repeat protein